MWHSSDFYCGFRSSWWTCRSFDSRIVDHLEKCVLFSDFYNGFRSSPSTADLLIELLGLITDLGLLEVYHLIYPMLLTEFGMLVIVTNLSPSQIFGLVSSFLSNMWVWLVLNGKLAQEYPVNAGVPQGSILGSKIFLIYINDLPDDVICNIAIYADDSTLYSKCDQISNLWQLELAFGLESDLRDAVDWGRTRLVDLNAGETQLVSFDQSNNTGAIDVKMDWSVLELTFSSNWFGALTLSPLLKLPPREMEL